MNPTMATYLWDYAAADAQYIDLYRTLKNTSMKKSARVTESLSFLKNFRKLLSQNIHI